MKKTLIILKFRLFIILFSAPFTILIAQTKEDLQNQFYAYSSCVPGLDDLDKMVSPEDQIIVMHQYLATPKEGKEAFKKDWDGGYGLDYLKKLVKETTNRTVAGKRPRIKLSFSAPSIDVQDIELNGHKLYVSPQYVRSLFLEAVFDNIYFIVSHRRYGNMIIDADERYKQDSEMNPSLSRQFYSPGMVFENFVSQNSDAISVGQQVHDRFEEKLSAAIISKLK